MTKTVNSVLQASDLAEAFVLSSNKDLCILSDSLVSAKERAFSDSRPGWGYMLNKWIWLVSDLIECDVYDVRDYVSGSSVYDIGVIAMELSMASFEALARGMRDEARVIDAWHDHFVNFIEHIKDN